MEHKGKTLPKKRWIILTLFLAAVPIGFLSAFRWLLPSHPVFGPIYEISAFDLNEARKPGKEFLRKYLPRRIVQSSWFPFKDQPKFFDLDGSDLEWSINGTNTGWIYFRVSGQPLKWEFAPCSETNLFGVHELPSQFYGPSDLARTNVFGSGSSSNALRVTVGEILFARRTDQRNPIYILKLKRQDGNQLFADYCATRLKDASGSSSSPAP